MAIYYWVGGSGTWDNSSTTNWSASSGGAGGAGYPIAGDTAIFNASSGGGTATIGATVTCAILTMTGYTGTIAYGTNKICIVSTSTTTVFTGDTTYSVSGTPLIEVTASSSFNITVAAGAVTEANAVSFTFLGSGSNSLSLSGNYKHFTLNSTSIVSSANNKTIYGNFSIGASNSFGGGIAVWTFGATSGTQTITSNGRTLDQAVTINCPGATVILADAFNISSRALIYSAGTLDANGFNFTAGTFTATGSGTRVLNMGSGTWTITGNTWNVSGTNITLNCGTSTLLFSIITGNTTITPANFTYYNLVFLGGSAAFTHIFSTGSPTFNDISNVSGGINLAFLGGSTYTFSNFNLNGTSIDDVRMASTNTNQVTFSKSSGSVSCSYIGVAYITATGGATWTATDSWSGGDTTGWTISDADTLYWVGGSGTWDNSSTTNWSATHGGAGGAGYPTSSTRVVFTSLGSGSGTTTLGANVTCKMLMTQTPSFGSGGHWTGTLAFGTYNIDVTGENRSIVNLSSGGTITGSGAIRLTANATSGTRTYYGLSGTESGCAHVHVTAGSDTITGFTNTRDIVLTGFIGTFTNTARTVWGSFTASAGMSQTGSASVMNLRASSPATINVAGLTINQPITINSASTYTLVADLNMSARDLVLSGGTFDADTYNVTCGSVTLSGATVVVYMGSGTWSLGNSWVMTSSSALYSETSTIKMTRSSSKTFAGGGLTYYNLEQAGAGALTVSGSNTFNNWIASYLPSTVTVTAGTTQTFTNFTDSGILGDQLTINSTAGTYTFSKASGTVSAAYLTLTNSIATGGATWNATYSTQTGCTGWNVTNLATTYYWVGGTGTWDNSSTSNWSLTSGGSSGAGYPLPADTVIFNSSSGGGTCTIGANVNCKTLTMTGYTGTLDFGTNKISIAGSNSTVYTGDTTYSISGTSRMDFVYPGRTGTRQISPGAVTEANAINTYITAGIDIIGLTTAGVWKTLDFSGFSGSLPTSSTRNIAGSFALSSTMTVTTGTGVTTFIGTGTHTINLAGTQYGMPVTINSTGGTYTLASNFDIGTDRAFRVSEGTFDAAGYNVSVGSFTASGATTKVINMGSGTWNVSSTGPIINLSGNLTLNQDTSTLVLNAASSSTKIIIASGITNFYDVVLSSPGITRFNNTISINDITNTVVNTVNLVAGITVTVGGTFGLTGNSGTQCVLASGTPGSIAYVSSSSGTVHNPEYLTITDIGATGGAKWDTYGNPGNVDGGNSPGWLWYQSNVDDSAFLSFF